ncbi:MAG: nucleotidyltransferase [Chloroflexi bacterium]|nr:nucleotidyltransferase [Chloroflexota bacterium]
MRRALELPAEAIARLARRYHVARLALFGSVLNAERFQAGSDVDMLVTFLPGARVSFLTLARLQRELSALLNRPVDMVPERGLKPLIREEVLATSHEIYAA